MISIKRPWQVWLALAVCAAGVGAAMTALTAHALRADRERRLARAEADLEQRVSLALWRMDTKLAPLIAEEIARPHFFYQPVIALDRNGVNGEPVEQAPSPLMLWPSTVVRLNFDATMDGRWQSPQVPPAELETFACAKGGMTSEEIVSNRQALGELAASVDVKELVEQLPEQLLPQPIGVQQQMGQTESPVADGNRLPSQSAEAQGLNNPFGEDAPPRDALANAYGEAPFGYGNESKAQASAGQVGKKLAPFSEKGDFSARNTRYQSLAQEELSKQRGLGSYWIQNSAARWSTAVVESVSRPLWVGDRLLLARRVVRDGETVVQGSWLDWPRLRADLLAETADLIPNAELAAVRSEADAEPTRMLAGLPVRLVTTGAAESLAAASAGDGPLHWALGVGWLALALALAAVAVLLRGVLALSERRAAFVSSVTHELRTPLTTFRMYAELLSKDMAPSAERRREYLETLRTEAERLTHLVENVLSYARLERGRRPQPVENTSPARLVERIAPRLAERAERSGMELKCQVELSAEDVNLRTDVGVVEQILFNLVDNAAKYAGSSVDRRIHLEAAATDRWAAFVVRDHGPGFKGSGSEARRGPFSKSAQEAAESAPGVGLGLALCRRLARELGGTLETGGDADGATVTLRLPCGASQRG